jgi:hypothetical protein
MFHLIEKQCEAIELQAKRRHIAAVQHKNKGNVSMFVSMMNGLERTLMVAAVLLAALPIAALVTGGAFA